ncbi:Hypothetical Protein FCC1311_107882, partial [Hondaea fermentalgiana]
MRETLFGSLDHGRTGSSFANKLGLHFRELFPPFLQGLGSSREIVKGLSALHGTVKPNHEVLDAGRKKTARVREQFEEATTDRHERVYPLQIVYISMANGIANTGHTSLAIRLLQNASGGTRKRKNGRQENLSPRVENLMIWF